MGVVPLSGLSSAIQRLEQALKAYDADPQNSLIRDAVIKRFEFTYELCQITLRRFVETYSVHLRTNARLSLPELIRTASQDGLVQSGWDVWHAYREARNRTSHTYNEDQAKAVMAIVPAFLVEANFLYSRMAEEEP